jgi:hypothetical protein
MDCWYEWPLCGQWARRCLQSPHDSLAIPSTLTPPPNNSSFGARLLYHMPNFLLLRDACLSYWHFVRRYEYAQHSMPYGRLIAGPFPHPHPFTSYTGHSRWLSLQKLNWMNVCRSRSYFTTDGQSFSMSWCRAHSGTCDQIILTVGTLLSESCSLRSVERPLWREDGSAVCSAIIQ